jgi:hypothetical protein
MPRTSGEHPFTLNEEDLMRLRICFLQCSVVAIELVVKKEYNSYQLMVLSRKVRYASTTSGVAAE